MYVLAALIKEFDASFSCHYVIEADCALEIDKM